VFLGYGVIGGIGLGLGIGYISPVSTLIKWFPDRPGLATGTAIMGFGGGALIGAPLAVGLMKFYAGHTAAHPDPGTPGERSAVRARVRRHLEHGRRRFRHDTGLPARSFRHAQRRRDPRPAAHGLVGGRCVAGPVLVNYIRQYQIEHGVAKADAYSTTMYIMAGLLIVGFICKRRSRGVRRARAPNENAPRRTGERGQTRGGLAFRRHSVSVGVLQHGGQRERAFQVTRRPGAPGASAHA
jgi:hypothetical protein